jgi:hypothetical protein
MQEVWGSNPHSSTVQSDNSNGSNAAYSSKVQQRRRVGSRTSVLVRSAREAGRRPELRAARDRWAADRLKRDSPLGVWVRPSSYRPFARASQGGLVGCALASCAAGRPLRWRRGRPGSPRITVFCRGGPRPGRGTGRVQWRTSLRHGRPSAPDRAPVSAGRREVVG